MSFSLFYDFTQLRFPVTDFSLQAFGPILNSQVLSILFPTSCVRLEILITLTYAGSKLYKQELSAETDVIIHVEH